MTTKDKQQLVKEIGELRKIAWGFNDGSNKYNIGANEALDKVIELIKETNPNKGL
jgi:hypothetical protein